MKRRLFTYNDQPVISHPAANRGRVVAIGDGRYYFSRLGRLFVAPDGAYGDRIHVVVRNWINRGMRTKGGK